MIIRKDETRNMTIVNKTLKGFLVNVNLEHSIVNEILDPTSYGTGDEFDASQTNVKVILKRDGKQFTLLSDNLGILGQFNSILKGGKEWFIGTDLQIPAADAVHKAVRTLFVDLGGHHNIKGTDELYLEVTVGRNSFNDPLASNNCYVEISPLYSIGKEIGVWETRSEVIQANQTREEMNLGDNVTDIRFLNFQDDSITEQILTNISIGSDRLDLSLNFNDLINLNTLQYDNNRWIKTYPYASGSAGAANAYVAVFPNSFVIHKDEEIDRVSISMTFNGANVDSSKNYVVYRRFLSSQEIMAKAFRMESKHRQENISKLPAVL